MRRCVTMKWVRHGVTIFFIPLLIILPKVATAGNTTTIANVMEDATQQAVKITDTIRENGMTFADPSNHFRIGIRPNIITSPRTILSFGEESSTTFLLDNETLRSPLYSYALTTKNSEILFNGALWISLDWAKRPSRVTLKYWNEDDAVWVEIPTAFDAQHHRLQGSLARSHATIGIFKNNLTIEGVASWYDWHGAAMNAFPIGTDVLVTNPKNGKKARTRVVSTGPYTPGRIIDLPRSVFEKIGDLWDGVMDVTVQPIRIVSRDSRKTRSASLKPAVFAHRTFQYGSLIPRFRLASHRFSTVSSQQQ